ncbi:unnamed protein product [Clonostachys rosea]|uniref:DUF899 domain-containing protein n=1 Tax=Bionectria ochroleuca TaxID=29856 RepID=A0ABY6UYX7_BIOOC|nr:unnamed protein product [Clonostachys rosea]
MTSQVKPRVVSRDEWLEARKALLEKEKEHTRANDALNAMRRELPMVEVDKNYTFQSLDGERVTLADLFEGHPQLIVYHFMFGPEEEEGCRGCSHVGESLPNVNHLRLKNTNLVCVSRGPIEKLAAFKQKNGWKWPWYSSGGTTFNYDFHASNNESVGPMEINFRSKEEVERLGKTWYEGDVPGYSVFFKDEQGNIYHSYSTWARGGEQVLPTIQLLDMTPLGRQIGMYGPAEFKLSHEY